MSLYGGIKFSTKNLENEPEQGETPRPADTDAGSLPPSQSRQKQPAAFSSALKFAPRINKKPQKQPAPSAHVTALPLPLNPSTVEGTADIVRSAEPVLHSRSPAAQEENDAQLVFGPDGLPLAKAPAMTIGAKAKGGYRDRLGNDVSGEKKKKKKKRKNQQPLFPTFDPEEIYDPNRPNDLGEYQQYRKRAKEERRRKLMEAKRRRAEGLSSDESSYYTDSEEDIAPRRDAPKMFAPPKIYSPSATKFTLSEEPEAAATRLPESQPVFSRDHDDSQIDLSRPPPSGDDAYARRVAMTQQAPLHLQHPSQSGDDAYARRAAISQKLPPTTSFVPSPTPSSSAISDAHPSSHLTQPPTTIPPPLPVVSNAQPEIPQAQAAASSSQDFQAMLEERKKAAEAIAAKFKALAGAVQPPPPPALASASSSAAQLQDVGGGTFAEKMMRKWGHVEGTGLGARGEGIVHALTTEHVAPVANLSQPLSKRALAKQKAAAANAKSHKWVQAPSARGRIVNENKDERAKEEKEKKGEEGRVICLRGLVGSIEEIDEDLVNEIGEECSNYGIVERVVLHLVEPPPPEPEECLRVFVVFSGMAGAWRAIKELDGRFFGGRNIKATYFDETRFDKGDRDGPVL
ncbi:splicing factor 45 [Cryptococcus neoformans c45]|nr:splicing factor 45 [Cryptococcus neoformans var. grubii c45]